MRNSVSMALGAGIGLAVAGAAVGAYVLTRKSSPQPQPADPVAWLNGKTMWINTSGGFINANASRMKVNTVGQGFIFTQKSGSTYTIKSENNDGVYIGYTGQNVPSTAYESEWDIYYLGSIVGINCYELRSRVGFSLSVSPVGTFALLDKKGIPASWEYLFIYEQPKPK